MKPIALLALLLVGCGKPVPPAAAMRFAGNIQGAQLEQLTPEGRLVLADYFAAIVRNAGPLTNSEGDVLMLVRKEDHFWLIKHDTNTTKGQQ